jgi:acetyl-CoA carboxylase carboxyltransferase component
MDELATRIAATSDEFRANQAAMQSLVDQLRAAEAKARAGGGTKAHERHRAQGKLPVRERLDRVLDPGSPFLELSPLAAWGMYDDEAPGRGHRDRRWPRQRARGAHRRQRRHRSRAAPTTPSPSASICRAQEVALANRLPCLYLVDSGGAFLPLQAEVFPIAITSGASSITRRACPRKASRRSPS